MPVKLLTWLLAKSREIPVKTEVARQYKPAALFGWWGQRVTVIKLAIRTLADQKIAKSIIVIKNKYIFQRL